MHAYAAFALLLHLPQSRQNSFTCARVSADTLNPAFAASTRNCEAYTGTSPSHVLMCESGHIEKPSKLIMDTTRAIPASTASFASAATVVRSTSSLLRMPPAATSGNTCEVVCSRQP